MFNLANIINRKVLYLLTLKYFVFVMSTSLLKLTPNDMFFAPTMAKKLAKILNFLKRFKKICLAPEPFYPFVEYAHGPIGQGCPLPMGSWAAYPLKVNRSVPPRALTV